VTIRARLILTLLLVGISFTVASVAIVHRSLEQAAVQRAEGDLAAKITGVEHCFAGMRQSLRVATASIARDPDVVAFLQDPGRNPGNAKVALRTARSLSEADALLLLSPDGTPLLADGPLAVREAVIDDDALGSMLVRGHGTWWTIVEQTPLAATIAPVTEGKQRFGLVVAIYALNSVKPLKITVGAELGATYDSDVLEHTFGHEHGSDAEAVLRLPDQPGGRRVAVGSQRYLMRQIRLDDRLVLGVLVPLGAASSRELFKTLSLIGVIAMAVAAVMLWFSSRAITGPLERLVTFARNAAAGELRPVERHAAVPEIAVLEDALNDWLRQQQRSLEHGEADCRAGRDREIDRWIQRSMLPTMPEVAGYDLALGSWRAADAGGDCCEAVLCDHGELWIAVGEVATRSLRAGMLATLLHGCLEAAVRTAPAAPPSHILGALDDVLTGYVQRAGWEHTFVALRLLRLGPDGGLAFAGAHEEMLLLRAGAETCEPLDWCGAWLGLGRSGERDDPDGKLHLAAGDTLLLYTDGLLAAQDDTARTFGAERIIETLLDSRGQPARVVSERLLGRWERFAHRRPDDATLVVIRRRQGTADPPLTP